MESPRFNLTFDPCRANIRSLCPLNSSLPIEANGIIPVSQSDVAGIPAIALSIPDFEGQAILRIFSNTTESQIGCVSAVITNGASFSHPAAVGSILGIFCFRGASFLRGCGSVRSQCARHSEALRTFVVSLRRVCSLPAHLLHGRLVYELA